jgi:sensor histidine kinase YesM
VASFAQPIQLGKEQLQQPFPLFLNNAAFYLDISNKIEVENIARKKFQPFSYYFDKVPDNLSPNKTWWMRVEVENLTDNDTTIIFYPGFQNYVTVYHAAGGRFSRIAVCGNMLPASQQSIPDLRQAALLPIAAHQFATFYISIKNVTTYQVDAFRPYLMSRASLDNLQVKMMQGNRLPHAIFFTGIGMFLIMFIYIMIKWLYVKDAAYFYYALTIFGSAAYYLFNFFKEQNNQYFFSENPVLIHLITDSFIYLSVFAYWRFVRRFLYIDKTKTFLERFMQYGSFLILAVGAVSLLYALIFRNITGIIKLNSTVGIFFLSGGIYILISIRKINQPLRRFIYGGILSLVIFSALGSLYEITRHTKWNIFPDYLGGGTPFLMIGSLIEMLFFTIGLAYRNKLEAETIASISIQKSEAEMKALRAQMNPHFIFNCMHTIDAYIFKEQPEKASAFLNKFSKLIRGVLENSQHSLISIDKEIESLQLFTALEQERFDDTFTVNFSIDPQLHLNQYRIPPLLIQPFAENAIQHGLRHRKETGGLLLIEIKDAGKNIRINIIDNGIGRTASQQIKQQQGKVHNSMAMELTLQRLSILPGKTGIEISDTLITGKTGTVIKITISKMQ